MPLISSAAEKVEKNAPLPGNEWQLRSSVQNQNVVSACKHCGLAVPAARIFPNQTSSFCCAGCEAVYQVLHSAGLEEYYAFRTRIGEEGRPVSEQVFDSMHEFDSESFRELYCTELSGGRFSTSLLLEGVHCAACVWLVEKVGRLESSVLDARLDIEKAKLEISWDPQLGSLSSIARRLGQMGYRPRPFSGRDAEEMRVRELRSLVIKMGVAGATAGNVMLMAFALYSGAIGFEESHTMDRETRRFFEVASLIVSLPALWAAGLFFRGAWASLRLRTPHMDLPIALGIGGGFIWGAYGALTGRAELYFDTITTLIFFLLVGRYIQRRHHMKARDAAELIYSILPATAVLLPELGAAQNVETRQTVARDSIVKGDYVWVESGGVLPLDGRVVRGSSSLDKSLLSGESRPVSVNEGDEVEAGALNLGQPLVIEAMRAGAETRVAQLMQQVERAFVARTPLTTQVDRLAGSFTISVIALAVFVAVFWWQSSPERALAHALSLLIVACPCALGLATPLALSSAVKKAAREKKLIFSGIALEQLGRPGILVLDKTGTLTQGRMRVLSYEGDSRLLPLVAEMERDARHPVAHALVEYCETMGPAPLDGWRGLHPKEHLGQGLSAQHEGEEILIGSQAFVLRQGYKNDFESDESAPQKSATPVYVSRGGHVCGRFWVGDQARPDAACSLLSLKKQGYRLHLLSGDHPRTTRDTAEELALASGDAQLFDAVVGGVLPEQKLAYVQELKNKTQIQQKSRIFSSSKSFGPVIVMVGDGINDAGALALADVGIAVHGAAEASRMSAQVYLANAGVAELLELIQGSKRTFNTIRRGIAFSLVYNALGISLAAFGILSPLIAAVLMPFSSLTVITNAYKSRSFFNSSKVS